MIAGEFYHHLLAKRVARTWYRFVTRKREERQREQEQMKKAKKFCEKKLWYVQRNMSKENWAASSKKCLQTCAESDHPAHV